MSTIDFFIVIFLIIILFLILFALNKINSTVVHKLNEVQDNFINHLATSQGSLGDITQKLAELKGATQNILEVGKDMQSLQDILKPPKLRGTLGELFLEQALSQVMPSQYYKMCYKFRSGNIVDAVVKLTDSKLLCIDSKFPLDSIKEYITSGGKNSNDVPSQFVRDVKKRIDEISNKYILPEEGTLDYALMYIPAESVYYDVILRDEKITQYAKEKHVIPVSPLSLYSYLSLILIGLKGIEVEKNTKQILGQIGNLKIDLDKFLVEFNTIGMHLNNARAKYDSSREIITNVSDKLKNIELVQDEKIKDI